MWAGIKLGLQVTALGLLWPLGFAWAYLSPKVDLDPRAKTFFKNFRRLLLELSDEMKTVSERF